MGIKVSGAKAEADAKKVNDFLDIGELMLEQKNKMFLLEVMSSADTQK